MTKEFEVPAGTPFFHQARKIRSEYEDFYHMAVTTENDFLLKYTGTFSLESGDQAKHT